MYVQVYKNAEHFHIKHLVCTYVAFKGLQCHVSKCLSCPVLSCPICLSVCLSFYSNQLSQHDEKERLMEADSANSDLHICVVCMKSLMNTTVSEDHCTWQPSYIDADLGLMNISPTFRDTT